jgi:hypothetical protein
MLSDAGSIQGKDTEKELDEMHLKVPEPDSKVAIESDQKESSSNKSAFEKTEPEDENKDVT